jgi:hypothetical protein
VLHHSGVVMIVAAITVLALGFEPFVQQSLRSPLRPVQINGASPLLQASTTLTHRSADIASNVSLIYNAVLLQGLYSTAVPPLQIPCPGTSCDWPEYETASVCSSCEDMLNRTTITPDDNQVLHDFTTADYLDDFQGFDDINPSEGQFTQWEWRKSTNYTVRMADSAPGFAVVNLSSSIGPEGYFTQTLSHPDEVVFDASVRPAWEPSGRNGVLIPNMTGPLSTLGYVRLGRSEDGLRLDVKAAMKCSISLCAREQRSTISNGTFASRISNQTWGHYFQLSPNPGVGYNWTATLGEHKFRVIDEDPIDVQPIVQLLDQNVNSLAGRSLRVIDYNPQFQSSIVTDPAADTKRFMSDVQNSSAKIAQAFTNYFHQNGDREIQGTAYTTVAFVDVRWAWLTFPLVIVVLCFANLIMTILQTRRHRLPVWRTSTYPLLFAHKGESPFTAVLPGAGVHHGGVSSRDGEFEEGEEEPRPTQSKPLLRSGAGNDSISAFNQMAKRTMVQLVRSDGHWIFEKGS